MALHSETSVYKAALVDPVAWLNWYYGVKRWIYMQAFASDDRTEKLKENAEWERRYHLASFGPQLHVGDGA